MMNIAVLGCGYWGPNLLRNFVSIGTNVKYAVDLNEERLASIVTFFPSINVTTDVNVVFNDATIDAVVIALPVFLHYEMAKRALLSGKHVLVEKPMTNSVETSLELIEIAEAQKKVLMCDHTFLYTGAVCKTKAVIDSGDLGNLLYFDSTRTNLGLFQSDINVIWDLAPHDISILCHLVDENPICISATGQSHTNNGIENISYITMFYQSNFIAHASVSWISPVKIRRIIIGGDKKMVLFDDIEPTEKIKIYDYGYNVNSREEQKRLIIDYRRGDIFIPKLDTTEALKNMAQDFVNSIENGTQPVSDAQLGLNVVKILQAAENSIKQNGKEVKLN